MSSTDGMGYGLHTNETATNPAATTSPHRTDICITPSIDMQDDDVSTALADLQESCAYLHAVMQSALTGDANVPAGQIPGHDTKQLPMHQVPGTDQQTDLNSAQQPMQAQQQPASSSADGVASTSHMEAVHSRQQQRHQQADGGRLLHHPVSSEGATGRQATPQKTQANIASNSTCDSTYVRWQDHDRVDVVGNARHDFMLKAPLAYELHRAVSPSLSPSISTVQLAVETAEEFGRLATDNTHSVPAGQHTMSSGLQRLLPADTSAANDCNSADAGVRIHVAALRGPLEDAVKALSEVSSNLRDKTGRHNILDMAVPVW